MDEGKKAKRLLILFQKPCSFWQEQILTVFYSDINNHSSDFTAFEKGNAPAKERQSTASDSVSLRAMTLSGYECSIETDRSS